jgi:cytochrome P450
MTATYDLFSPAHFAEPYETFALMRQNDPLYWHEPTGLWFASRYTDVHAVLRDRRFSAARVDGFMPTGGDEKTQVVRRFFTDWMVFQDPPEHTRLRKLISHAFAPRNIAALESYIQHVVDESLDRVKDQEQIDIIRDLALPVPALVIAHMLGVAADRVEDFKQWTSDLLLLQSMVGDQDENLATVYAAVRNLDDYFHDLIAERRVTPTDDLLSLLVQAREDGSMLSEHELVANCAQLLMAGHETTTNLIGNATIALLRNPGELARLRADPGLASAAVEEFMRYDGTAAGIARQALEDVELSGGIVPAGGMVMGIALSANRDPAVFADPDRLDVGRGDSRHLGFAGGPHACIGAALARLQIRIAMTSLLARYPRIELASDELSYINGWMVRGVTSLPVTVGE